MQTSLKTFGSSALISFLLILPFMIMELVNRQSFRAAGKEDFPIPLFIILWFLSLLFILIGIAVLRNVGNLWSEENRIGANLGFLLLSVVFLVGLAWAWGSWIIDQIPCFLGVPNCD